MPTLDKLTYLLGVDDRDFNRKMDGAQRRVAKMNAMMTTMAMVGSVAPGLMNKAAQIDSAQKISRLSDGAFSSQDIQRLNMIGQLSGAGQMGAAMPRFMKTLGRAQGEGKGELAEAMSKIPGGRAYMKTLKGQDPKQAFMNLMGYGASLNAQQGTGLAAGMGIGEMGALAFDQFSGKQNIRGAAGGQMVVGDKGGRQVEGALDTGAMAWDNFWVTFSNFLSGGGMRTIANSFGQVESYRSVQELQRPVP